MLRHTLLRFGVRLAVPFGVLAVLAASTPAAAQPGSIIRVQVLARASTASVSVEPQRGTARVYADRSATPLATLTPGSTVTLERVADRVRVRYPGGTVQARVAEVVPDEGIPLSIRSGTHRRLYQGALSVEGDPERRASLRLVNYVPLEAYVASVVASEYPFTEAEGVKAQAVLARTYALRAADPAKPFDVTDDTGSQVYRGEEIVTAVARSATEATRGEVLRYGSSLVEATYYSSSGGHTANNDDVWRGTPIPYLRGKPDAFDSDAPDYRWSTSAEAAGTLRALGRRYGGTVTGFEVEARARDGRVTRVRLLGSRPRTISGNEFRTVVNGAFGARTVRSTHFTATRRGNRYVFEGRGFGHGVGMSQYGARGRARAGHSYRDILAFYFTGTYLDHLDPAGPDVARPVTLADFRSAPPLDPPPPRTRPVRRAGNTETDEPARRTAW